MRAPLVVLLALFALGCGSRQATAPEPEPPAAAAGPVCEPDALQPALESYDALVEGRRFTLELARDERGAWAPASPLAMPLHHASSIEWHDRGALDAWTEDRARVVATAEGRTSIEHDERRATWFATYAARIEHVCVPE